MKRYFSAIDNVWSRMKMAKIKLGDVLSGQVAEYRRGQIIVRLENNLCAFVDSRRLDSHDSKYN